MKVSTRLARAAVVAGCITSVMVPTTAMAATQEPEGLRLSVNSVNVGLTDATNIDCDWDRLPQCGTVGVTVTVSGFDQFGGLFSGDLIWGYINSSADVRIKYRCADGKTAKARYTGVSFPIGRWENSIHDWWNEWTSDSVIVDAWLTPRNSYEVCPDGQAGTELLRLDVSNLRVHFTGPLPAPDIEVPGRWSLLEPS